LAQVVLAKEAGICYAAVAMATDYDCWRDQGECVSVVDVLATFKKNAEKVTAMFKEAVPLIGSQGHWDDVIDKLKVYHYLFIFIQKLANSLKYSFRTLSNAAS
jgi:5'-methylthioadenosine phosphorylase